MANEITVYASLSFSKGSSSSSFVPGSLTVTMTGTDYIRQTQTIGFAAAEALDLGDITTPGYLLIKNLDATNFVEIRDGSGGADVVKLKAGEVALFRLTTTTPFLQADTGNCIVEYLLLED